MNGRNEEELVGSDDEFSPDRTVSASGSGFCEQAQYSQKRAAGLVKRIAGNLSDAENEDPGPSALVMALATVVMLRQLYALKVECEGGKGVLSRPKDIRGVGDERFSKMCEALFRAIFSERQPLEPNTEVEGVAQFEDYQELLAFTAWIAWAAGYRMSSRKRVSAEQADRYAHNQANAALVFLSQRLAADEIVRLMAAKLMVDFGQDASDWLQVLVNYGEMLLEGNQPPELAGYSLVKSPHGSFSGVVLAIDGNQDYMDVIKMGRLQPAKFQQSYLELVC